MAVNNLTIKINGDTADFQKALGDTEKATKKLQQKLSGIAVKATVAFAGLSGTIAGLIRLYRDQEVAEQKLTTVLQSTGGAAGMTKDALIKMANELQKVTLFGDETTIAAQALMLTFTKIGKDVFPDAIMGAMNMSAALKTDLNTSTLMLGKALNDPIAGITALTRSGVQFTEEQKNLIKSFMAVNKVAEAQTIILKELEIQFGGQAKAAVEGTGRFIQLQGAIGDLGQAIGKGLVPSLSDMADWLNKILLEILEDHGDQISEVAGYVLLFSANLSILTATLATTAAGFYSLKLAVLAGQGAFLKFGKAAKMTLVGGVLAAGAVAITKFQEDWTDNIEKMTIAWRNGWTAILGGGLSFFLSFEKFKKALTTSILGIVTLSGATLKKGVKDLADALFGGMKSLSEITAATFKNATDQIAEVDKRGKTKSFKRQKEHNNELIILQTELELETIDGWVAHREEMHLLLGRDFSRELSTNNAFNDLMINSTNKERTKILTDLGSFQLTKQKIRDNAALKDARKKIKDRNEELKLEAKFHGFQLKAEKKFQDIRNFMNSERVQNFKSTMGHISSLMSESSRELFFIGKAAAIAQGTMDGISAVMKALSSAPWPWNLVLAAGAALASGVQMHKLLATGPPKKMADGGIVTGGIRGIDSVPIMAMPGELIVPAKNFEETVNAVGGSRNKGIFGNDSTTKVLIGFDGEEASQVLTARQIENQALGISIEEAA